jgi:hypothetical protein
MIFIAGLPVVDKDFVLPNGAAQTMQNGPSALTTPYSDRAMTARRIKLPLH